MAEPSLAGMSLDKHRRMRTTGKVENMDFKSLTQRAAAVRAKYDEINAKRGVSWNEQALIAGFVGDVGGLSKKLFGHILKLGDSKQL